ncbi:MAG: hypothetical protein V7742_22800 [Halioglobus sp.]
MCSFLLACHTAFATAQTYDKLVLVLATDDALHQDYSTLWAKAQLIDPLIEDARTHKVVYSLPFCEEEQPVAQCEADASIKLVIEVYGPVEDLEDIASSLIAGHPELPLAAYQVRERQPRAYTRDWPLGEASPGIRMIALMVKRDHLTAAEFDAYWRDQHTPKALAQPIPVWNYLQNTVTRCQGACGDVVVDGIALEQFRNASDPNDRWFKTPWWRIKGLWSATKFMDLLKTRPQYMTEYIVKA